MKAGYLVSVQVPDSVSLDKVDEKLRKLIGSEFGTSAEVRRHYVITDPPEVEYLGPDGAADMGVL